MSPNKSKSYILPLYNSYIDIKFLFNIKNTYCFKEDSEEDIFIIVYNKIHNNEEFNEYIEYLKDNNCVKELKELEEEIIVFLNIPYEISIDYNNFLIGKFSHFKSQSKRQILKFLIDNYGDENLKVIKKIENILYKKESLRKQLEEELLVEIDKNMELSSVPDTESETLYLKKEDVQ